MGRSYSGDKKIAAAWPDAEDIDYRHFFDNTGIAVDRKNEKLYLRYSFNGVSQQKVYAFSDIRKWSANAQTGGHFHSFGTGGINQAVLIAAHNARINRMNEHSSGLFIEVRDIDFPEWRIAFPSKSMDHELSRWIEILRQVVNDE